MAASSPTRFQMRFSVTERRRLGVVEVRVALAAEPIDCLGVPQQLPLVSELLIFTDSKTDTLQLTELKLDELQSSGSLSRVHL